MIILVLKIKFWCLSLFNFLLILSQYNLNHWNRRKTRVRAYETGVCPSVCLTIAHCAELKFGVHVVWSKWGVTYIHSKMIKIARVVNGRRKNGHICGSENIMSLRPNYCLEGPRRVTSPPPLPWFLKWSQKAWIRHDPMMVAWWCMYVLVYVHMHIYD